MYHLIRSILFLFDPEKVHYFSMNVLKRACRISWLKRWIKRKYTVPASPFNLFRLSFKNRVGLGAGFDKNANYLTELDALGFGFVEIGTVTPLPQKGNEQPRLFRLPKDKALINRMGFNNDGAALIAARLKQWRAENNKTGLIIGGNIGKNKITPNEDAWKDYITCFSGLHEHVDYFVVNVSSPNTPGLRELQEKESLRKILQLLQQERTALKSDKPILLKIAPDLEKEQLDDVIDLALQIKLDGLVATNTTISREKLIAPPSVITKIGAGGLSGMPLKQKSTGVIQYIYEQTKGQVPIIGSGGIFSGKDAKEKMDAGALLLQVWTGFIYEGPSIVKNINASINKTL